MLILPQILYLFRTLHVPIEQYYLGALSTLLKKYVWQGKRARCSHKQLNIGQSVVWAWLTSQIITRRWNQISYNIGFAPLIPLWEDDIEKHLTKAIHLHHLLQAKLWKLLAVGTLPITTKETTLAWRTLNHSIGHSLNNSAVHFPILVLEYVTPNLSIRGWDQYGINLIEELLQDSKPGPHSQSLTIS